MYGKLFASLYQGTLRGQSDAILVFTNMIAFADSMGFVDKHPSAIADETGLPIERVKAAIAVLMSPDPESRSPENDGKRLVFMDEHRSWGWIIVNYQKYRSIKNEEDRREQNRIAQEKFRNKRKQVVSDDKQSKPSSAQAEVEAEAEAPPKVPQVNTGERVGDEPKIPKKLDTPRFKDAFDRWQAVVALESTNGKPPNAISLQGTLEKLASYPERKACGFVLAWIDKRRIYTDWKADWETYQPSETSNPFDDNNRVYGPKKKEVRVADNGKH